MKKVCALFSVPLVLAHTFFPVLAEEEDPPTEYIKIDIPTYSYSAYQYWFNNGFSRFQIPLDDNDEPLMNQTGISITETINLTSTQANSTYTETDTYSLSDTYSYSGTITENIKGSLYVTPVNGPNNTTNYTITTGAGSAVGNLPVTGTESLTGTGSTTGTVSASGTIHNGNITSAGNSNIVGMNENQITYVYNIPWLTGQYVRPSGFDSNNYISITTVQYFVVYTDGASSLNPTIYYRSNRGGLVTFTVSQNYTSGIRRMVYKFTAERIDNGWVDFSLSFANAPTKVIPVYIGNGTDLTDEQKSMFGIHTNLENTIIDENNETQTLIDSGTSTSQTSENHVNTTNNTLSNKVTSLENYESTFNSNLNSSLNGITLPDVGGVAKFGNAARWVSAQFTRLVSYSEIQFPLIFCLSLGLALTLLGRIRS